MDARPLRGGAATNAKECCGRLPASRARSWIFDNFGARCYYFYARVVRIRKEWLGIPTRQGPLRTRKSPLSVGWIDEVSDDGWPPRVMILTTWRISGLFSTREEQKVENNRIDGNKIMMNLILTTDQRHRFHSGRLAEDIKGEMRY